MAAAPDALARARDLLDLDRVTRMPAVIDGYLDTLAVDPPADGAGARLMRSGIYPLIYERIRPIGLRLMSGLTAPGRDDDRAAAAERLGLAPGAVVLDVACGPGNFTGWFGSLVGPDGLAIGLDASVTMLAKAVHDNAGPAVAYLRGNAEALPLADATVDAVSCFAALYLISDPYAAVAEAVRVLRPGGRIAVLTSYEGRLLPVRLAMRANRVTSGIRAFGRDDITGTLERAGMIDIRQQIGGVAQSVWAVKP